MKLNRSEPKLATATLPQGLNSSTMAGKRLPWLIELLIGRLERAGVSRLRLSLPDGRELAFGQAMDHIAIPRVSIHRYRTVLRGWFSGMMGWAEGYIAKDWDCDELIELTDWAMANEAALEHAFSGSGMADRFHRLLHRLNANSKRGSKRNISFHYDMGNAFYRQWLDSTMTYSSALFEHPQQSLEQAQVNKNQRILELLQPQAGDRVLEIGCGWGGFGQHLLEQTDCHWHGITLSQQQLEWSRQRLQRFGDRAQSTLTDYRDLDQQYDRIVSIEMLEAVGERNWPLYFDQIKRRLKAGGRAVIQVITIHNNRFEQYRSTSDFIQRYIFPGGMLPCSRAMREQINRAGLKLSFEQSFGHDYARTLQYWHQAFCQSWPRIQQLGFDQRFYRLWRYYLAYCESGFKAGSIDVRFYQVEA